MRVHTVIPKRNTNIYASSKEGRKSAIRLRIIRRCTRRVVTFKWIVERARGGDGAK